MVGVREPEPLTIRELAADDDLSTFDSGNQALDRWLRKYALGNQGWCGRTYLAVQNGVIVGFVTLAAMSVGKASIDGDRGPSDLPALLVARMAVRRTHQKQGIGGRLMTHAFQKAYHQHLTTGCAAVIVDAKPGAASYYERFNFIKMEVGASSSPQTKMYIAMGTVIEAMGAEAAAELDRASEEG